MEKCPSVTWVCGAEHVGISPTQGRCGTDPDQFDMQIVGKQKG